MRTRWLIAVVPVLALYAGPVLAQDIGPDAAPAYDLALPDQALPDGPTVDAPGGDLPPYDISGYDGIPTSCAQAVGKHCTSAGTECGLQANCLMLSATDGICTCTCTADDPGTPLVNEDTCPELNKNICGTVQLSDGTQQHYCFRLCQPKLGANDCDSTISCHPSAEAFTGQVDKTVCLYRGCTMGADCPVLTGQSCNTGSPSCGTGETCLELQEGSAQGLCAAPGNCDAASGLCDKHSTTRAAAKVGDPCKADTDCGEYMSCQIEFDPTTLGGKDHGSPCATDTDCCGQCSYGGCQGSCAVHARNGYCVVRGCTFATATAFSEFACPTGSSCNQLFWGGMCMKTCDLATASDCRGNAADLFGDYECRAWNNLSVSGTAISDTPVCDFGDTGRCSLFANVPSLDCTYLGTQNNPTDMSCRTLDNVKTGNPKDPRGFCLDDTPSGPPPAGPDAGPEGGVPDGGPMLDYGPGPEGGAAGDDSVGPDGSTSSGGGDGCGCEVGGRPARGGLLLLLLLGLALAARRR